MEMYQRSDTILTEVHFLNDTMIYFYQYSAMTSRLFYDEEALSIDTIIGWPLF